MIIESCIYRKEEGNFKHEDIVVEVSFTLTGVKDKNNITNPSIGNY